MKTISELQFPRQRSKKDRRCTVRVERPGRRCKRGRESETLAPSGERWYGFSGGVAHTGPLTGVRCRSAEDLEKRDRSGRHRLLRPLAEPRRGPRQPFAQGDRRRQPELAAAEAGGPQPALLL